MRASTPDRITGTVDIIAALAGDAAAEPQALVELLSKWVRAVEIGFFGPARIRLQGAIETQGRTVSGRIECEDVSEIAVLALSRMIQHFSKATGKVGNFSIFHGSRPLVSTSRVEDFALPQSIPFVVEYPEEVRRYVRVEIEFRDPLVPGARDAIFDALAIWDVLIEALGDEQEWGEANYYETRLLSPRIVEHDVEGYFASFECLYFIVWLGLRLHQRLIIERITME